MTEKEHVKAAKEAQREITAHPDRANPHEDALTRYLGSVAYAESHRETGRDSKPGDDTDDTVQQPADRV